MKVVALLYFKPVTNEIIIKGAKIRSLRFKDLKTHYNETANEMTFIFGEIDALMEKQGCSVFDDFQLTIFEYENENIPEVCIEALFDLVYNNWIYKLEKAENTNIPIGLKRREFNPPYIDLTDKDKLILLENGLKLLSDQKRFRISLQRWATSFERPDAIDTILDCCSSLESLLNFSDELRLKLSLSVYHILSEDKKNSMISVYNMYGVRNTFIHGRNIPEVTKAEQNNYINVVANILLQIIKDNEMPDNDKLSKQIIEYYA